MGALAAEALQPVMAEVDNQKHEYTYSKRALAKWGGSRAVEKAVNLEVTEAYENLAYDDYESSLREMLRTDRDHHDKLDIDDIGRKHKVIGGKVRSRDGTPMVDVTQNGVEAAAELAEKYPDFKPLVVRDKGDKIVAEGVDQLRPGETLEAVSWYPKQQLQDPALKKLFTDKGYRDGIIFIQTYSRTSEDEVVSSYYSVDVKDEAKMLALLKQRGFDIPTGTDYNEFIRHYAVNNLTPEKTYTQIRKLRNDYYQSAGMTHQRYSITEYIDRNESVIKGFFNQYYPALADAAYSGINNETMQRFASTIMAMDIEKLKPEIKRTLIKVAHSQKFDNEAVKVMDSLIRYAVVEELRKNLKSYVSPSLRQGHVIYNPTLSWGNQLNSSATAHGYHANYGDQLLAQNLSAGVRASRSYGGCPGINIIEDDNNSLTGDVNGFSFSTQQTSFGGRGKSGSYWNNTSDGDCEFVSKKCPECKAENVKTKITKTHISGSCGCVKKR